MDGDLAPDIVTVSANSPSLQLFENRVPGRGGALAVRLVGGCAGDETGCSNRDGIGARVVVTADGVAHHRELRAGEGMAGQSSKTLLFGVGDATTIQEVEVRWPSGQVTHVSGTRPGQRLTIFEDPGDNGGRAARVEGP